MENTSKTWGVILIALCIITIVGGCSTSIDKKDDALPAHPMDFGIVQSSQVGYVYCELEKCPQPTQKTPLTAQFEMTDQIRNVPALKKVDSPVSEVTNIEVKFDFNKSKIKKQDRAKLLAQLKMTLASRIKIVGRSGYVGSSQAQTKLAKDRIAAIRAVLSSRSSSLQFTEEVEVAGSSPVEKSVQDLQRRGTIYFYQ